MSCFLLASKRVQFPGYFTTVANRIGTIYFAKREKPENMVLRAECYTE